MGGYSGIGNTAVPLALAAGDQGNGTVTSGATSGVYGAWTTILTTTAAVRGFLLTIYATTYTLNDRLAVRLATGPGGAEVLLHGPIVFVTHGAPSGVLGFLLPFDIPANTRLAASVADLTSNGAIPFQLGISCFK